MDLLILFCISGFKKGEKMERNKKIRNIIFVSLVASLFFCLSLVCWFREETKYSESERRSLATFPTISTEAIVNKEFMEKFETFSLDQFPWRDSFRSLKAIVKYGVFFQKDNNGIYMTKGHLSKMEPTLQTNMLDYASEKITNIYNKYLKEQNSKCYFTVVPDKNFFLSEENGYLSMNYENLFSYMKNKIFFAEYLDITPFLDLSDYYKTDTHWKQECIMDVAVFLNDQMTKEKSERATINEILQQSEKKLLSYELMKFEMPFYGVYYGQAALPMKPDTLYYLQSEVLKKCKVTSYDTGKPVETVLYNMEKGKGKDAYELFLSGTSALQMIENPFAENEKELLVFRDSFGSSLIPLLVDEYSKITVIDIRYVQSDMLGTLVDFHGQDTLFLYSTLILNNSLALR